MGFKLGFMRPCSEQGIELMEENTNQADGSKLKYRGLKVVTKNYKKISGQIDGANNFKLIETEKKKWDEFYSL